MTSVLIRNKFSSSFYIPIKREISCTYLNEYILWENQMLDRSWMNIFYARINNSAFPQTVFGLEIVLGVVL